MNLQIMIKYSLRYNGMFLISCDNDLYCIQLLST